MAICGLASDRTDSEVLYAPAGILATDFLATDGKSDTHG